MPYSPDLGRLLTEGARYRDEQDEYVIERHAAGEVRLPTGQVVGCDPLTDVHAVDPVVHLAEGHHKNIETLITEVEGRLGTWSVSADNEDGEVLAHTLQRLAAALYEHMGLEERLVLPLAERHVFATEWAQMQAQAESAITPENGPLVAGMVMYEGGAEILPEEMRAVVAEIAPSAYAAYCERVHGTPTPPRSTDLVLGAPFFGIKSQDSELVR